MATTPPGTDHRAGRVLLVGTGLLFAAAIGGLAITGHHMVRFSSDTAAQPYPLWMPLASSLVVLLFTRWVPPNLATIDPLAGIERPRLRREAWVLVGAALAFPALVVAAMAAGISRDAVYAPVKVLMLLVIPLLACRTYRAGDAKARWIIPWTAHGCSPRLSRSSHGSCWPGSAHSRRLPPQWRACPTP